MLPFSSGQDDKDLIAPKELHMSNGIGGISWHCAAFSVAVVAFGITKLIDQLCRKKLKEEHRCKEACIVQLCYPQYRQMIYDCIFHVAGMIFPEVEQAGKSKLASGDRHLTNKANPFEFSGKSYQDNPAAQGKTWLSL